MDRRSFLTGASSLALTGPVTVGGMTGSLMESDGFEIDLGSQADKTVLWCEEEDQYITIPNPLWRARPFKLGEVFNVVFDDPSGHLHAHPSICVVHEVGDIDG